MPIAQKIIFGDNLVVTDEGSGTIRVDGVSGGSPVDVVGPFNVTYQDITGLNVMTQGFVLTSFVEGVIILDVWAVPVTPWNNADARLQLSVRNINNFVSFYQATPQLATTIFNVGDPVDWVQGPSNGWDAVQNLAFNIGDNLRLPARVKAGGCEFVATLDDSTGTPTAGEIDVYALIYTP